MKGLSNISGVITHYDPPASIQIRIFFGSRSASLTDMSIEMRKIHMI